VRGAEDAARLLNGLVRPVSGGDPGDQMFTLDAVKEIAVARFEMVVRDVVGHPTAPGSNWDVEPDDPAVQKKTLAVDKLEPCGAATCARVSTQYDYKDEIVVEPSTLIDHFGTFSQTAKVRFVGASGQPIPVEFRTALEQSSAFP